MRTAILLVALVLCTVLGVGPAYGDTAREQAGKAFAAGEAADQRGDYRTAIEHYLEAYELVPHHFALYNIGVDYERLGEYREAAAWFQRYLQAAPPPAEGEKVQRLLRELKLRPAKLTVKTNVPNARVFIDGQYAGKTPFEKPVRGGGHRVRVELAGQRDERDVYLEYGEPKEVELTLRTVKPRSGPTGTLDIGGAPPGATVTIDGQRVGQLPSVKVPVIPGPHQIDVTKYGYQPWGAIVEVTVDQVTPVQVLMVREGDPPIAAGQPGASPSAPETPGTTLPGQGLGAPPKPLVAGYLIGVGGGADLRGNGPLVLVDFGVRARRYDASIRYGKSGDLYAVDLLIRAALFDRRLTPYVGGGYAYLGAGSGSGGGSGLEAVAGIRYDLTHTSTGIATLLVETGVRYHADIETTGAMPESRSGLVIPLLASIQYTYGRQR